MGVFLTLSGVNMYAMLTGTLPFTVEPFSLRALHQKMVDKEMNPLPPSLSTGTDRVNNRPANRTSTVKCDEAVSLAN